MIRRQAEKLEWRCTIPASLEAVDRCVAELRPMLERLRSAERFALELLAREALTNAVLHGSRQDPALQVEFVVRINAKRVLLAVADTGPGFDWRAPLSEVSGNSGESGRGRAILAAYSSRVRYNAAGNAVALAFRLPTGDATGK